MPLARDIRGYLKQLDASRRLSKNSVTAYAADLNRLRDFLDRTGIETWQQMGPSHGRQYAANLHRKGLSSTSIRRSIAAARGFYRYLCRTQATVNVNPFDGLAAPKTPKRLPEVLATEQIGKLVSIPVSDDLSTRDRAILELFYSSGLRLSELAATDLRDMDFSESIIRVTGKGGKTREVPVGRAAVDALRNWLKVRSNFMAKSDDALFLSKRGRRISVRTIQARITYWAKRQGIDVRVHPHLLRHTFASHVLESSQNLRAVQEMLGHANIATTQIYTHLDYQQLAKVYDGSHPRAARRSAAAVSLPRKNRQGRR